ncbi:hypothetical protein [Natrinema sp. H-ect4]|jgi:hypothetical protein|uniref:hypothetical protein n=1 Tax=Natrinema sp. H-ect4 TaxID=3242699 RepID=UPI0035A8D510
MSGTHKQDIDSIGIWGGGVTSGLIAGIAMGLVLHLGGNQIELLGGLATEPSTAIGVGWTIHLMISVVFGLLFAAVASRSFVRQQIGSFGDYIIMGLVFGAVIGLFAGGVVFPLAMERAGVAALPLPFLPVSGATGELVSALVFGLGHLVYGLVLGVVFATINGITPGGVRERVPVR